jgi:MoaA/NifB/PqqE/SkfB family radical SAM enzyme
MNVSLSKVGSVAKQLLPLARQALPLAKFAVARATGRKFPLMVTMSITDKCNFRCDYCDLPKMNRDEMSTADWHRAIDELADAGMMRVSIMGGEPLMRKDVGELIDHLKERGINVAMNTNGWLFAQRMEHIRKLDLVCVTLDGPPEINDRQRHPGAHDKVLEAIDLAKDAGVKVITMTVMTKGGLDTVDYVLKVAREKGTRAFFQVEHPADGNVNLKIGRRLTDDGLVAVARHLLRRKEEGWPVGPSKTFLKQLAGDGEHGARRFYSCNDCFASQYFLSITPSGFVVPCPLTYRAEQQLNGREVGFAKAFEMLNQPTDAGCGCNPTTELNYLLHFRPEAILNAFDIV